MIQFSSVSQLCPLLSTPWTAACQASLSISNSWSLLKLMSIELVMLSNHLILGFPLLFLPSIFPSIRVFSKESVLHISWPYIGASASVSILPMNILCNPRDSQESSQFKCINFLALSLSYGPNLTFIHDYWKNHSFDYTDHCC